MSEVPDDERSWALKIEDMTLEQARKALHVLRDEGIRQAVGEGRWCEDGLNETLREAGLDEYGTGEQSTFTFEITVDHEVGSPPDRDVVEQWLRDLVNGSGESYLESDAEFKLLPDEVRVVKKKEG